MNNTLLLAVLLLANTIGNAQTLHFTLADPQPSIMEAYSGTFASGDIDGDGDMDLFMTGATPQIWTRLYTNDGVGNFTEVTHLFPRSGDSQAFFIDFDGDEDLDVFFSGKNELSQTFSNIYSNNGSGVFTLVTNTGLPTNFKGTAFADVDNDGDQDMVLSTSTSGNSGVYLNNGSAVFSQQTNSPFDAVDGVVAFIDMENDGDQDVLISGDTSIQLYENDGSGGFSLNTSSTFASITAEDIDVADTDNDGDLDFLINGNTQNILYINDGLGVFTSISTSLQQTFFGKNALEDLDNDGDVDILICGSQAGGVPNIFNIVYENTGNNTFVQTQVLGGEYIADCIAEDFNGDSLKDIIIQGFVDRTNVYWNTSTLLDVPELTYSNQDITVYPNPITDVVHFSTEHTIEHITIYNSMGLEVISQSLQTDHFTIDLSALSSGTYIGKLHANKRVQTIKLSKI